METLLWRFFHEVVLFSGYKRWVQIYSHENILLHLAHEVLLFFVCLFGQCMGTGPHLLNAGT